MKKEDLKDIKLFVLDMDGTIYLSNTLIEGSLDFINHLRKTNKGILFFTNNSSRTGETYVEKLNKMGFKVEDKDVMTSGDVTIKYQMCIRDSCNRYIPSPSIGILTPLFNVTSFILIPFIKYFFIFTDYTIKPFKSQYIKTLPIVEECKKIER